MPWTPHRRAPRSHRHAAGAALVALLALVLGPGAARAGGADVVAVKVTTVGERQYRFEVTVRHADEGWQHYADTFEVVDPDGKVLSTRRLRHPHVNEQPFTRTLARVKIPHGVKQVTVRAHDKLHGFGGLEQTVEIGR